MCIVGCRRKCVKNIYLYKTQWFLNKLVLADDTVLVADSAEQRDKEVEREYGAEQGYWVGGKRAESR